MYPDRVDGHALLHESNTAVHDGTAQRIDREHRVYPGNGGHDDVGAIHSQKGRSARLHAKRGLRLWSAEYQGQFVVSGSDTNADFRKTGRPAFSVAVRWYGAGERWLSTRGGLCRFVFGVGRSILRDRSNPSGGRWMDFEVK